MGDVSDLNNDNISLDADSVRVYVGDSKDDAWRTADFDASPKAGQVFFSQQAAELSDLRFLTGQVTFNDSPVQGAVVYAFDNTDKAFLGDTTTDSNGNYSITPDKPVLDNEVLISVDHDTGSERFGEEKSTVV